MKYALALALQLLVTNRIAGADTAEVPTSNAVGLAPVGSQPKGSFTGKIVYAHGGHGITADNKGGGRWSFQRGEGHEMIEDLGNYDQMTLFVDYLFCAGATVVPLRPVGHQTNEVVMDNDDPGVTFEGEWTVGKGPVHFGNAGGVPYRETQASAKETAYARYRPTIPTAGFYPLYSWTSSGSDRVADQLYRVQHSGGATEVTVNHRRVGNGLVYLGTYHFDAGSGGYVDISNRSASGQGVVVADMIRFGNGMGDIDRGGGVSGLAREDEAGLYWVKWHVDRSQGIRESDYRETDVDRQATISLSPRYAQFMNRESDGRLQDRVFVSFHSNAGGRGKARGTLGLVNGNNDKTTATPNQLLLARSLAQSVNDDLVAQKGAFEHDWHDREKNTTLDREDIQFGEINNRYNNDEFDATIVEVGFHDNEEDAELMRDARVRDAIARATYQGLLTYFREVDNNTTPETRLPTTVTGVHVESGKAGSVTISWTPGTLTLPSPKGRGSQGRHLGDAASGFRVYASTNGYGFDGGKLVDGGDTKSATLDGLDPKKVYDFKVAAVNEGGESPASEVVAALPSGQRKDILIVNGFDRLDRTASVKQPYRGGGNTVDRCGPRQSNSRDYVVQVATAIESAAPGTAMESASNEAVADGRVELSKYRTVIWILGEESTSDRTFDDTEHSKVEAFVAGGGNLFVSGTGIGLDLDHKEHGRSFFHNTLRSKFVADDAGTYEVAGVTGGIFADLPALTFDNGTQFYDADSPDVIEAEPGAAIALNYANGSGAAGVQAKGAGGRGSVVILGFPFETISTSTSRAEVMRRVLTFFRTEK